MLRLLDRSRPDLAVPLALATELPGQREPRLRLGGLDFGSSQVLLDIDVERPSNALMSSYSRSEASSAA
jgi:hypothetical protein